MDARIDPTIPADLREVVITRTFDAPRELVWKVWTDPEHLRAWWGPHGYDAPHPSVDLRAGGFMNLDMRAPDGTLLPNPTTIREVKPPEKLVIASTAFADEKGNAQLEILQTFTFAEDKGKTRLTIKATVLTAAAAALPALKGMRQGWTESLEKIDEHLAMLRWVEAAGGKATQNGTTFLVPAGTPVVVTARTFDAPRDLVWRALTDPAMRSQWWGPADLTNHVREMDVRPGGKWRIDQTRNGETFSFWGEFRAVMKPARLVDTFNFADFPPVVETITLAERGGRTTLTLVGRSDSVAARDAAVKTGMERGARESMDRLAALLKDLAFADRVDAGHRDFSAKQGSNQRKVSHGSFTIERTFDAPAKLVFNVFADQEAKNKWFGGPAGWVQGEKWMDFRVGGREVNVGGPPGGLMSRFDCHYYDIIPDQRIVYAYEMYLDDIRISVSVATLEFRPAGPGTKLVLTEQGAFLDGFDDPALREEGTRHLMEALARALKSPVAA
jgi:uncharacterized protein YndB with AHSA1/START domain